MPQLRQREPTHLPRFLSQERVLLVVFGAFLLGMMGFLAYTRSLAADAMRVAMLPRAEVVAARVVEQPEDLALVVANGTVTPLSAEAATAWLEARSVSLSNDSRLPHRLVDEDGIPALETLVTVPSGGFYLARTNSNADVRGIDKAHAQLFVFGASIALLQFALVMLGTLHLFRVSQTRSTARRAAEPSAAATSLHQATPALQLRSRWPAVVALSLLVFSLGLTAPPGVLVSIAFIAVVVFTLWRSRTADTYFAAVLATGFTIILALLLPEDALLWNRLANHTLSVFAVWTVAMLGVWQKRTTRAQGRALAQAQQANIQSDELRVALKRTEAAENALRRGQQMLQTVCSMVQVGGWRLERESRQPQWTREIFALYELVGPIPPSLADAVQSVLDEGKPFDLTLAFNKARGNKRWIRVVGAPEYRDELIIGVCGALQDVTQQHDVQARLQRASRFSSEGHWDLEFATRAIWVSAAGSELLGGEAKERRIAVTDFEGLQHPDDAPLLHDAIAAHIKSGTPLDVRFRMRTEAGEWRWYKGRGGLERSPSGRPVRLAGSFCDVHEETLALQDLEELRLRFQRAIHGAQDGLWEWDINKSTVWMSPRFRELLGHDKHSLPGTLQAFIALLHPDDRARAEALTLAHVETGQPYEDHQRLRTRSGDYRWFRTRGQVVRGADRRPLSLAGSVQDISAQIAAEAAHREAERRLSRAIDGSSDGLFEWNLQDHHQHWHSPRLREMLGDTPDHAVGYSILERLSDRDRDQLASAVDSHFETGQALDQVFSIAVNGTARWFRVRGRGERAEDQHPLRFSGSVQDITTERESERALIDAKEAAAGAAQAKSNFLANMSHEIRTPMNGVIGMTELLLDTPLESTQRECAETIDRCARSLLTLINDILDLSKIDAGRMQLEQVQLDVPDCVESVAAMLAVQATAKSLELNVRVDPALPAALIGDPQRIRQILTNLLGNALKFTSEGEVSIEVSATVSESMNVRVRFEVRDSGIGISTEAQARLFEPFSQADVSTTRHHGGTGLGLSIVKRLVELMGGTLGVSSQVGVGSTFWFELPLERAATGAADSCAQVWRSAIRSHVLICTPFVSTAQIICEYLQSFGCTVSTATEPRTAAILLSGQPASAPAIDVALVDHLFHDSGLIEAAFDAGIRCVLLSAFGTSTSDVGPLERSISDRLSKPVRYRELLDCVARLSQTHSGQPGAAESATAVNRQDALDPRITAAPKAKILIVEDNPVNQMVARRFVERLGFEVEIAPDGAAAVFAVQKRRFDLILMDVQMPIMDGLEATRRIRQQEQGQRHTPIVALTASAMTNELERCLEAGMDALLPKPLDSTRLAAVLRDQLAVRFELPIDLDGLQVQFGDDAAFVLEICNTYAATALEIKDGLLAALAANDRRALRTLSHKLKGSSLGVGAASIARRAGELELHADSFDRVYLQQQVLSINDDLEQVISHVEARYGQRLRA